MKKDLSWLRNLPGRPLIVAEVKTASPFDSSLIARVPSKGEQLRLCEEVGDIISIHTNPLWGGSWEWLAEAREWATKPILAKGFHDTVADVQRALDCGADYVLTVGWHPPGELGQRCWHEVESLSQLLNTDAGWVVWNARDPRRGVLREGSLTPAGYCEHEMAYAREFRSRARICQGSMIRRPEDVHLTADAILIGEGLYA